MDRTRQHCPLVRNSLQGGSQWQYVNEVMYEVGYNDSKAFREVFKKVVGMTPADYKEKYSNGVAMV